MLLRLFPCCHYTSLKDVGKDEEYIPQRMGILGGRIKILGRFVMEVDMSEVLPPFGAI